MNSLRKHLSYANVAATMALVFAMGGSAIAAKHYLITKTTQIKPSVLKKLTGKTGKTGERELRALPARRDPLGRRGPKAKPARPDRS